MVGPSRLPSSQMAGTAAPGQSEHGTDRRRSKQDSGHAPCGVSALQTEAVSTTPQCGSLLFFFYSGILAVYFIITSLPIPQRIQVISRKQTKIPTVPQEYTRK